MCLRNKEITSNSHYFSRSNLHRFVNNCGCGKCSECVDLEQSQWYLRMYWQARLFFDRNGYIIYDTLTYSDEYIKHLSDYFDYVEKDSEEDFTVVSYQDVRDFLKRLRITLTRRGIDVKNRLKYFIASEYGDDHIYKNDYGVLQKATVRPHYHCLFYLDVDRNLLSPQDFIVICQECWKNGNTDNYKVYGKGGKLLDKPYFGNKINENIFGKGFERNDDISLRKVTNYVSKYIRKSDRYTSMINERIMKVMEKYEKTEYEEGENEIHKRISKEIKDQIGVFHIQSQGFGYYAIDTLTDADKEYLIRTGNMRINDVNSVVREIPCPMYYIRKLFYNYRRYDGRIQWYLTDAGLYAMKQMSYYKIARVTKKYEDWYINLSNEKVSNVFNYEFQDDFHKIIDSILDGREFSDLALYGLYYRGRILYENYDKNDLMPTIDDIMDMQNEYNIMLDEDYYAKGEGKIKYYYDGKLKTETYKQFFQVYCINENTEFENEARFRNFDLLLDIVRWTSEARSIKKETDKKAIDEICERLRSIGFKTKI